jgi:hypothetical protein
LRTICAIGVTISLDGILARSIYATLFTDGVMNIQTVVAMKTVRDIQARVVVIIGTAIFTIGIILVKAVGANDDFPPMEVVNLKHFIMHVLLTTFAPRNAVPAVMGIVDIVIIISIHQNAGSATFTGDVVGIITAILTVKTIV